MLYEKTILARRKQSLRGVSRKQLILICKNVKTDNLPLEKYPWGIFKSYNVEVQTGQAKSQEKNKNHQRLRSCHQEEFCKMVVLNIFSKTLIMYYLRKSAIFSTPLYKNTSGRRLLIFYFSCFSVCSSDKITPIYFLRLSKVWIIIIIITFILYKEIGFFEAIFTMLNCK